MKSRETRLLEEAYLSIRRPKPQLDAEPVSTKPNSVVSTGSLKEPAPGVDMNMIDSEVMDTESEDKDTTGMPVSMSMEPEHNQSILDDPRMSEEDENEEDAMSISNLNSIRESIMKIAAHCAKGDHLEPWQQQKLAIAMDNLAEVARRIPGC